MSNGIVIARGGLNLRRSPATGKVLKSLRRSSHLEILGEETWLRVRTRDGLEGFVLADFVERDPADLFFDTGDGGAIEPASALDAPDETVTQTLATDASDECDIRTYSNARFIGETLRADVDFFPALDRLNTFAEECDIEIFVTSSAREPDRKVTGAIVPPASRSNHLVGHAIDMNLKSGSGFFNSAKLKKSDFALLPEEIRTFLDRIRSDEELRWGGDFSPEDPVHIDDALNRRDAARWDNKLASRA